MGKTYRKFSSEGKKPKLPRGEYRAKWHMVHDDEKIYNRKNLKNFNFDIEEENEDVDYSLST